MGTLPPRVSVVNIVAEGYSQSIVCYFSEIMSVGKCDGESNFAYIVRFPGGLSDKPESVTNVIYVIIYLMPMKLSSSRATMLGDLLYIWNPPPPRSGYISSSLISLRHAVCVPGSGTYTYQVLPPSWS